MRLLKNLVLSLTLLAFLGVPVQAQSAAEEPEAAKEFLKTLSDEAFSVWQDPTLTEEEREEKFRSLLLDGFYIEYVARLALGRYTRQATDDQFSRYLDLFPRYTVEVMSSRLGEYGNERVEIQDTAPAGPRGDLYIRTTIVRPNAENVLADWRVRKIEDGFKIVDVKLEGISMVRTQREDFQERINKDGIDGLLNFLAEKAGDQSIDTPQGSSSQASN